MTIHRICAGARSGAFPGGHGGRIIRPEGYCPSVQTVRSVLNGLRWRDDRDFALVEVEYLHRGVPGNTRSVRGPDIIELEPWMMVIRREDMRGGPAPGRAAIPYHRILRVRYDGKAVFDRSGKRPPAEQSATTEGPDEGTTADVEEGRP